MGQGGLQAASVELPRGRMRTCQTKVSGAGESRMDGRKRAMWNVGSATTTRFTLARRHSGRSGSTCWVRSGLGCGSTQCCR